MSVSNSTADTSTKPDADQVIRARVDVAQRARLDLQAWMQNHGHDLDTAELIVDIGTAIRKAGIK
jgi:hypothetical protein